MNKEIEIKIENSTSQIVCISKDKTLFNESKEDLEDLTMKAKVESEKWTQKIVSISMLGELRNDTERRIVVNMFDFLHS